MNIKPVKRIRGNIGLPGDKSISHRAIMAGAIAKGITRIKNIQNSDDCNYTISAFKSMGVDIYKKGAYTVVEGRGLKGLKDPKRPIFVGSSGTTMRLLAGILAGQRFDSRITGDGQLSERPMERVAEPLSKMGVRISLADGGHPPISIRGGTVKPVIYEMAAPSAQIKSAVLFAGLYARGTTAVVEKIKSRDHTERMLKYFGADIRVNGLKVGVKGVKELRARTVDIPGDISSASFFLAGAVMLKGSKIKARGVGINPTRAGIMEVLKKMGARIKVEAAKDAFEPFGDVTAEAGPTKGIVIKEDVVPSIIDELPIIFVVAALSNGRTVIRGVRELRVKETDRIRSMQENLNEMGAKVSVAGDDVIIDGVRELEGSKIKSYGDHRTCMAMAIAALAARGPSEIDDTDCVSKSFPEFFGVLQRLTK